MEPVLLGKRWKSVPHCSQRSDVARAGLCKDDAGGERGWTVHLDEAGLLEDYCVIGDEKTVDGVDARPSEDTPGRYLE